jgi:photosystem II stability/assembly factor-like uncharacterized protein
MACGCALAALLALQPPARAQSSGPEPSAHTTQGGATSALAPPATTAPAGQTTSTTAPGQPQPTTSLVDPALFGAMRWRDVGPFRGGRALAGVGVPSVPGLYYFGAAAGGVWQSIDFGTTWQPIFDSQNIGSIGTIAVAPSDPKTIYVGTGEGALRGDITYGNGVYKSADAGKTWTHIGLDDTRQIGALIVDPHNSNIVLVAAIGHAFGPSPMRGIYRTTDGGKTWTRTLYRDDTTGAIDVTFDPSNPKTVYAALWQVRRQPWNFSSGGPGSGLFRSTDGGVHWTELKANGLPDGILGRIDVSVSAANPARVYAMIEAKQGGLYRSDDHGAHWKLISQDGRIRQRAWYFSKIFADPKSPDTVFAVNTGLLKSTDAGKTFNLVNATHGDHHFLWIDPSNPTRMIDTNDGGASISLDAGLTWSSQDNQPTAAIYHIATDNRFPYWLYGAQQDNSNLAIASYSDNGVIGPSDWYPAGGGECGFVLPDPRDAQIIVSDSENSISRYDRHTQQAQDISAWPVDNSGHPASELAHRFNWTSPMLRSPHDPDAIYVGSEVVWKTTDHGHSWAIISPDLTRNDKSKQTASGGPLTKDITSVEYYDTIFAMAESPIIKGQLWAGSDDGLIHVSPDDGAHWNDVTPDATKPGAPLEWSEISLIEPSHYEANTAYVAIDRHKLDDIRPYALKTQDGGKTWQSITTGLPDGAVVHAVREDPVQRGLLYAGTERGVFVSFDAGAHWQSLQMNLPVSPVHDLLVRGDDLAIATHGRGFWILDDITPLRQLHPNTTQADVVLYTPESAIRLYYPDDVDSRHPVGQNPPAGALIDYTLKTAPTGELTIDILDSTGKQLRHMSSTHSDKQVQPPEWPDRIVETGLIPAKPGMNRLVWDLRMDDPVQIPGAFYSDQAPRGPIVAPGQYQVKLTVNGQSQTKPLTVLVDPRVGNAAIPAIAAKTQLAVATTQDISALHQAVNDIRAAKSRLVHANSAATHCAQADKLSAELGSLEQQLMQVNMKGSEANLAFPGMLNEQYATFQLTLSDADTPVTTQHQAMYDALHQRLQTTLAAWQQTKSGDLAAFNTQLKQNGACAR